MRTYDNPVIPGFHPDPSVCRVGEDYYLVCGQLVLYFSVEGRAGTDDLSASGRGQLVDRGFAPSEGLPPLEASL